MQRVSNASLPLAKVCNFLCWFSILCLTYDRSGSQMPAQWLPNACAMSCIVCDQTQHAVPSTMHHLLYGTQIRVDIKYWGATPLGLHWEA